MGLCGIHQSRLKCKENGSKNIKNIFYKAKVCRHRKTGKSVVKRLKEISHYIP